MVRRPGRESRRTSRPPVLSVAQARGELSAQLAYGTFHRRIADGVIAICGLGFGERDRGTASWLDQTLAADGVDCRLGRPALVRTSAARSMIAAEHFERGTKPGRLLEQLLKVPFDATDDLFKGRHSSYILITEGAPWFRFLARICSGRA